MFLPDGKKWKVYKLRTPAHLPWHVVKPNGQLILKARTFADIQEFYK